MLFSQFLSTISNPNFLSQITGQTIEFDSDRFDLTAPLYFKDCIFKQASGVSTSLIFLNTFQGLRFESCTFQTGLCIWGQVGLISNHTNSSIGPNIFIEGCKGEPFFADVFPGHPPTKWKPKIQLSGVVSHSRIQSCEYNAFELSVLQCVFSRLDIEGYFSSFQISHSQGQDIYFKNANFEFTWLSDSLTYSTTKQHFDDSTILNLSKNWGNSTVELPNYFDTMKYFLESLQQSKSGEKFSVLNDAVCKYIFRIYKRHPIKHRKLFLRYGIFKNFYSLEPWIYIALIILALFSLIYICLGVAPQCAIQDSIFSFSGNPPRESNRDLYLNSLNAIEAYIGLFYLLVVSYVFGRKYTNYD